METSAAAGAPSLPPQLEHHTCAAPRKMWLELTNFFLPDGILCSQGHWSLRKPVQPLHRQSRMCGLINSPQIPPFSLPFLLLMFLSI